MPFQLDEEERQPLTAEHDADDPVRPQRNGFRGFEEVELSSERLLYEERAARRGNPFIRSTLLAGVMLLGVVCIVTFGRVAYPGPTPKTARDLAAVVKLLNWNASAKLPPWLSPIEEGSSQGVAVVLGQSLKPDGSPPEVLVRRAAAAKSLLDDGKVTKVIVCGGDPAGVGRTEASKMKEVLVDAGVAEDVIIMESQSTTTAENAWFVLRWIPQGTGQLYLITSDFHMARAAFIFSSTFNYFYQMVEDSYRDQPAWKSKTKRYPRLTIHQVPVESFCGADASLNQDDDPEADINMKSLRFRATKSLKFLGSDEVADDMYGPPKGQIMYIWPIQIDTSKDPEGPKNFRAAMAQATNVAQALCQCVAPPQEGGAPLAYPLLLPISTQFPPGKTAEDWQEVIQTCQAQ